jgi:Lon protease-like protein
MGTSPYQPDLSAVPVFPLPGVVLLPNAVLPLHIFEERYRAMTEAALESDRQMAMALLADGWQQDYYGRPKIEPVVCVGKILTHERLPDGKFNFLLQGHTRARVVQELQTGEPFRRFELQPIADIPADELTLATARRTFLRAFETGILAGTPIGNTFAKLLSSEMPTGDIADLVAFSCLDDVTAKLKLLAEPSVQKRVEATLDHLVASQPPAPWPPVSAYQNPSEN